MKQYFKCSGCREFHEVEEVNFRANDKKEEYPLCKNCFNNWQDRLAYEESDGEFTSYEDWMESRGATICDNVILRREL